MKYKVIITALIISGLLTSCQDFADDFFDTPAQSTLGDELIFSNAELAQGAVDGIKVSFGEEQSYRGRLLTYQGLNTDSEWLLASSSDNAKSDLVVYDAKADNTEMNSPKNAWAMMYEGIERANLCIRGLRMYGNPKSDNELGHLLGEALTLRAIYYADLVRNWGDVPARFEPVATATIYIPKTSRDVIYKQLIADLGEASTLVAWPNGSSATTSTERINKAFVKSLRARLAMMASGYQQYSDGVRRSTDPELSVANMYKLALAECRSVIASGSAHLEPTFEGLWRKYNQENLAAGGESLWEIPFAATRGRVLFTFAVRHDAMDQFQQMGANKGGVNGPLPFVFYDYEQTDTRRDVTCVPYKWGAAVSGKSKQELTDLQTWYFGKYRFEWMNRIVTAPNDDGVNKIYMRYAEVLLIAAETANELEGPGSAAVYLKEIRRRAFAPANHAVQVDAYVDALTSKTAMMNAIVDENKYEFTGEMERKFALIRWNLLKEKLDEAKDKMANLKARTGKYQDVPSTLYYKYKDDQTTLDIYGLNRGETQAPAGYISKSWDKLEDAKITTLYKAGVNPDKRQFWPIWQTFIDASNGQLTNDWVFGN
ncbi:putative outer membrane starch-binding protein [Flavobacterium sp. 90]|uniref:RagB/SusD family nutrient uptake outer membrane protein n=1 Tax=unclassified Flavobacterium TaxID=196869 RepID=UPI000EADE544|nr:MULTISPECIES: RagB/SusD family nutrient uptake outer membrane protein [unclassified Flavobacterium]RKR11086.1 putative outer membrane starch-binding protein [Flavobacterium sp. 81]TCK54869.1 putative outer membrane starch-binding protein [Flavobacterium sp. 90]